MRSSSGTPNVCCNRVTVGRRGTFPGRDTASRSTTALVTLETTMRKIRPAGRYGAAALALGLALAVAGCGDDPARWYSAEGVPAADTPAAAGPVNLAVTSPAEGATNVPAAAEIAFTTDAASSTVDLTDASGAKVDGSLRADKSAWVPGQMLKWGTRYTAKITATSAAGRSESRTLTFTTMAKPGNTAKASTVIGDGQV